MTWALSHTRAKSVVGCVRLLIAVIQWDVWDVWEYVSLKARVRGKVAIEEVKAARQLTPK